MSRCEWWRGQVGVLRSPSCHGVDRRDQGTQDPGLAILCERCPDDRVDVAGDSEHGLESLGQLDRAVKVGSKVDFLAKPLALEPPFDLDRETTVVTLEVIRVVNGFRIIVRDTD